jgi:hypothetical protein
MAADDGEIELETEVVGENAPAGGAEAAADASADGDSE